MGRAKVHYIDTRILLFQTVVVIIAVIIGVSYLRWTEVTRVEFSSPEFKSSYEVTEKGMVRQICKGVSSAGEWNGTAPEEVYLMKLYSGKETRVYRFAGPDVIYDIKKGICLQAGQELYRLLNRAATEMRMRSPYGELLNWEEVKQLFPLEEKAMIQDLDTGKSFMVSRKGGTNHADVKPLTANDLKAMREIFGSGWTWKKRAVVVRISGRKAAAALTGMPRLQNGEAGCFDVRFPLNSDRQNGDTMACRLMYYRAAGRLDEMLVEALPGETVLLLFTALDQQNWDAMNLMLTSEKGKYPDLEKIIGVTVYNITEREDMVFRLLVSVSFKNGPYNDRRNLTVRLREDRDSGAYLAEPDFLSVLLAGVV